MKRIIATVIGLLMVSVASRDQLSVFAQAPAPGSGAGLGSTIVFSSTQHVIPAPPPGLDADPRVQLYIMNPDGSEPRQLTDFPGFKIGAVCSPDGQQIAFHGRIPFSSRPVPTIFVMKANTFVGQDGNGLEELVSGGLFPSWSPNGTKIAFQSPPPQRDVFVLDLATSELTNLTNDPDDPLDDSWEDYRADWSPDGRRIAFTSDREG